MNGSPDLDAVRFHEARKARGWHKKTLTTAKAIALADDAGCWHKEFLEAAVDRAKAEKIRQILRDGYQDGSGNLVRNHNIEEVDPVTGRKVRGYKQTTFMTPANWRYVVIDARKRCDVEYNRFREICREATEACGVEFQQQFDFAFPDAEFAEVN